MTEEQIIIEALKRAQLGLIAESETTEYRDTYRQVLDSLLEIHEWIFSYNISGTLVATTDGEDLNFKYKYVLPGDTIEVKEVNPQQNPLFLNVKDALRFGYAAERRDLLSPRSDQTSYLKIGNILHSDVEVDCIAYRRKVTPDIMTATFREYFIYELATIFATTKSSDKMHLIHLLRKTTKEKCLKAVTLNNRKPVDPHLQSIYSWVERYIKQTYARY